MLSSQPAAHDSSHGLPDAVRVIVRGWLSCNQILLADGDTHVLVDTGHKLHAEQTVALVRRAAGGGPIGHIINTHCHVDHMGGNAAIQRAFGARIAVPVDEAPGARPWRRESFWMEYADQDAEPFDYDDTIAPGDRLDIGALTWHAVAAPGHDMGALIFFCSELGLLLSGDALWEKGLGVVLPSEGARDVEAALETLAAIESLKPRIVVPGHGEPFADIGAALAFSRRRLEEFRADPRKQAKHVLKVMLVFTLLARGSMPLEGLPGYLEGVPVYADLNREFFTLNPQALAEMLVTELLAVGAVEKRGVELAPCMKA